MLEKHLTMNILSQPHRKNNITPDDANEIISRSVRDWLDGEFTGWRPGPGIYMVRSHHGQVYYIGVSSRDMGERLHQHYCPNSSNPAKDRLGQIIELNRDKILNWSITFFVFKGVKRKALERLEKTLIKSNQPRWNARGNRNCEYCYSDFAHKVRTTRKPSPGLRPDWV